MTDGINNSIQRTGAAVEVNTKSVNVSFGSFIQNLFKPMEKAIVEEMKDNKNNNTEPFQSISLFHTDDGRLSFDA